MGDERDFTHRGTIDFRENRVETATGTIRVRGRLDNPLLAKGVRLLYPGMFARVRVPKSEPTPQTVIPEDCLVSGQEGRFPVRRDPEQHRGEAARHGGRVGVEGAAAGAGQGAAEWMAINPSPAPAPEGQPPVSVRRQIKSIVAITAGLQETDRVILDGLQQARPGAPVAPEEWTLTPPPAEPKKP